MKKPSHRGPRRRATEAQEDAAEPQESSVTMTEHTEQAPPSAEGTTRAPQAATNGNGAPTAPASDGAADSQTMHRAEELVDRAAERVSQFVSVAGRKVLQWFSRAREEVEDIVAEAQHIRRGGDK